MSLHTRLMIIIVLIGGTVAVDVKAMRNVKRLYTPSIQGFIKQMTSQMIGSQLKPNLKVFIGIPFLGTGVRCESFIPKAISSIETQRTGIRMLSPWVTSPASMRGSQRDLVAAKLNDIVDRFLKTDCTHVWLVNADCELPPDALEKLIRLDVDIASGVSPTHSDWNETTAAWEILGGGLRFYRRMDLEDKVVGENEVVTTGNFCTLIKRRALLQYSPHHEPLKYQIMRERQYIYGPELQFFIDAQKMGFSVRIHGGVMCGHLPEWPLSYEGHEDTLFKKIRGLKS